LRHHSSYRSLTIALDRRLWRDPTHLQPPTGALVLVATKDAGNKLHDLLRDRRSLYQGKLSQLRCTKQANAGLQLRRAISIRPEGKSLLEKHAVAPSAARLCYVALWH